MEALGLPCIGPQLPNCRQADPWPEVLPGDNLNVPDWRLPGRSPAMADRQLDCVFADARSVHALDQPEEWDPSDRRRIAMEFSQPD